MPPSRLVFPTDPRLAAAFYLERGLCSIPVLHRRKAPALEGWQALRARPEDLDSLFPTTTPRNVGLLTGTPSGGLIDVDLDVVEAVLAARLLLPPTAWVFGRASKPRSHLLYQVEMPPDKAQLPFRAPAGTMLAEIHSTGWQVVAPPSVHPGGEIVTWERLGEPGRPQYADLERAVRETAACALLARAWPGQGCRQDAFLALAGGLLRAGWNTEATALFLRALALATRDEEAEKRVRVALHTAGKVESGDRVTGWPTLAKYLGERGGETIALARHWLGVDDAGAGGTLGWPDPVLPDAIPEVPAFPLEVLPGRLGRLVEEVAWALNCPPDFAAVPLLVLAGGALGNSRHLALTSSHTQSACLFAIVISPPGTAKSPALKLLRRPFDQAQQNFFERYHQDLEAWEAADEEERGPRPIPRRCLVSDTTTESLMVTLSENRRGVVMVRDELAGLVTGMNQYKGGKGHDRQIYLALWSGDTIVVDRKSDRERGGRPLYITDPFTAIIGGTQPDVLPGMRSESRRGPRLPDDGFFDRFLVTYPCVLPASGENWRQVSREALDAWQEVVERLLDLSMVQLPDEEPRPHLVYLTSEGRAEWECFARAHAAELNADDFPPHLVGPWSKLRGYMLRLALVVHALRLASGETVDADVDGESMARAARLVAYFKAHAVKVHAVLETAPGQVELRRLLGWLQRNRLARFSKRDAYQALRGSCKTVEAMTQLLVQAERYALIRPEPVVPRPGPGRKASPCYEVNPMLLEGCHNPHNARNHPPPTSDSGFSGDCGNAPGVWDDGQAARPAYRLIDTPGGVEALVAQLGEVPLLALDTETTGLDPLTDRVRLLSLAWDSPTGPTTCLVDCFAVPVGPILAALAGKELIAHNARFDLSFLRRLGLQEGKVHDTMLLSELLHAGKGVSVRLAACVERELGRHLDKAEQKSCWTGTLSEAQLAYAVEDALVLLPLYQCLHKKLEGADLLRVADIETRALPAVVWMSLAGVPIDTRAWQDLADLAVQEADELRQQMGELVPNRPGELWNEGWNWDSAAQVVEAFALLGIEVTCTGDAVLAGLDHPLARLLRRYRAARKRISSYGADWLTHVRADGRIYPDWRQLGSRAGRMSCARPNMQQLPRQRAYRCCVRAPEGRVLLRADYSQIELRIAACISGDRALLEAYQRREDLHTRTARAVLGVEQPSKEQRQLAKALNFGLLYGMGAQALAASALAEFGVVLTEKEAGEHRAGFFRAYPGLHAWQHRTGRHQGEVMTRTQAGRRRQGVERFTEKLNTPVQGTGADGLKQALALLWERRAEVPSAVPVLAAHDEIVVECDQGDVEKGKAWLRQCMVDGMQDLITPVPVEVEVQAGQTWAG